jgi:hypothetical protein
MKLEFYWQILEKIEISSFIKIRPMGAELFHVDATTDAFRNFGNVPKNGRTEQTCKRVSQKAHRNTHMKSKQ